MSLSFTRLEHQPPGQAANVLSKNPWIVGWVSCAIDESIAMTGFEYKLGSLTPRNCSEFGSYVDHGTDRR